MKPRPIYKWKSFWLGVLVLLFMGWAAWKSQRMSHTLTFAGEERCLQVMKLQGSVVFVSGSSTLLAPSGGSEPVILESRPAVAEEWIAALKSFRIWGVRMVTVPDRLLFFCFLGLWGGWLIWQWSREQRKLE